MQKLVLFLLLFSQAVYAQDKQRGNEFISPNGQFFLRTISFSNTIGDYQGKSIVYRSDSTKLYEIQTMLNGYNLFLSNDGQTIIIINYEGVIFYKQGRLYKKYERKDLIGIDYVDCDDYEENCSLFYKPDSAQLVHQNNSPNRKVVKAICKNPLYHKQDTLVIFANKNKILKFSVETGGFTIKPFSTVELNTLDGLLPLNRSVFYITCPSNFWKLPNTIEGESFETALGIFLDMRTYNDSKEMESYKFSSIDLLINVNSEGKVVKTKIKGFDEFDKIDTNKVKNFLSNQVFEHKYIDKNVGEWCFSGSVSLANKNPKIAKRERKNEIRKRPSAEYIKSIYIPKNIEECFTQLDKLLDPKTIARMKKAKSASDAMTLHHFGLGMWLRNNWGLWGGSRLQKYMLDRNVEHPDSMSSTILEFYYDWLHDRHDDWKAFDKKK